MKPFSFVHAADLHLDCPFSGLSGIDEELASELRESTHKAFKKIVDLCIENDAAFLLVAGDVYEGPSRGWRAQTMLRDELERLREKRIEVFIAHGNHDPLSSRFTEINWPDNVTFFLPEVTWQDVTIQGEHLARVYGVSYQKADTKANLAKRFRREDASCLHIGVLHCSVTGASSGHESYAACSLDDLGAAGMDYWALGHVHRHAVLSPASPTVVYPGNPQGRHINEDEERGCYVVQVDAAGNVDPNFVPTLLHRWKKFSLDIAPFSTVDDMFKEFSDCCDSLRAEDSHMKYILRILLSGRGAIHADLAKSDQFDDMLEQMRADAGERITVESLVDQTMSAVDMDSIRAQTGLASYYIKHAEQILASDVEMAALKGELGKLYASPKGKLLLDQPNEEKLKEFIQRATAKGVDRLVEGEPQ